MQRFFSVAHEKAHFLYWLDRRNHFMAAGFSQKQASIKAAWYMLSSPIKTRESEAPAVAAEIEQSNYDLMHPQYVQRLVYPEISGLLNEGYRGVVRESSLKPKIRAQIIDSMDHAIESALRVRQQRFRVIEQRLSEPGISLWRSLKLKSQLARSRNVATLKAEMALEGNVYLTDLFDRRFTIVQSRFGPMP